MPEDKRFTYRVTDGWLRDLASEPVPQDRWPSIRWGEQLVADQIRFLDVQAEMGVDINAVWGLFVDRNWPVPFESVIDGERAAMLRRFVDAAHERHIKVLSGVGVYSWGFEEVIARVPGVSKGHPQAMCAESDLAWQWQQRVLDFLMDERWNLDGISMQSSDQGRCGCDACSQRTPMEHHAELLVRSAEYVREHRPDWTIGMAAWGLRLDEPSDRDGLARISKALDYIAEAIEHSSASGERRSICAELDCAFGSIGGAFASPPQHWERTRWFLPTGLAAARSLAALFEDGGRACEYFYRLFANPGDEVSWRTGAAVLSDPELAPEEALSAAVAAVYRVAGEVCAQLTDWYRRAEEAYLLRTTYRGGVEAGLNLEPLIWKEDPFAAGPPVYLTDRLTPAQRSDYAADLAALRVEFERMAADIPASDKAQTTLRCLDGVLYEIESIG